MSMGLGIVLADYDISVERGFLPLEDPLRALPDLFLPWEDAARDLPKMLMTGSVRAHLATIPMLEVDDLTDPRKLDRAMLILSYLGSAWVWGERELSNTLPSNIAVPWVRVARRLNRPPVLSYASHALNNWRRVDPSLGVELGNVVRLLNFLGGLDEEWFVLVHIAIEAKAGPAMSGAVGLRAAIRADDDQAAEQSLIEMSKTLRALISILQRMPENCDPYIYYKRVRPFIFGWHNPDLPHGVHYEGVVEWAGQGQRFRGETGAQSAIIPAIDAALGVRFEGSSEFAEHLEQLRHYMPLKHREFIARLETEEAEVSCRDWIVRRPENKQLRAEFNAVVEALHAFRRQHLEFARSFIAHQEPRSSANPNGIGTGGTPFMHYLHDHVDQTLAHRV